MNKLYSKSTLDSVRLVPSVRTRDKNRGDRRGTPDSWRILEVRERVESVPCQEPTWTLDSFRSPRSYSPMTLLGTPLSTESERSTRNLVVRVTVVSLCAQFWRYECDTGGANKCPCSLVDLSQPKVVTLPKTLGAVVGSSTSCRVSPRPVPERSCRLL